MTIGGLALANLRFVVLLLSLQWLASHVPVFAQTNASVSGDPPDVSVRTSALAGDELRSLSISGLTLHAKPPVAGETAERPKFTREMIQVQWRQGDPIDLYVIRPHGVSKPRAVLYLYSYPSETTRFQDNEYCERITANGLAAIGFVSAMTGHRYHDRPMKDWFVSEMPEALTVSVHDVQMILNYLTERGDFDLSEVGMFGQGSGATIAILSASVDNRIRVLDLLDPWGDWPQWFAESSLVPEEERNTFLKPEFLARVAPFDPVNSLPELRSQKMRIQVVKDDTITPSVATERLVAAAPKTAEVVRYATTRELYGASSGGRLFEWIADQIMLSNGSEKTGVAPAPQDAKDHKSLP